MRLQKQITFLIFSIATYSSLADEYLESYSGPTSRRKVVAKRSAKRILKGGSKSADTPTTVAPNTALPTMDLTIEPGNAKSGKGSSKSSKFSPAPSPAPTNTTTTAPPTTMFPSSNPTTSYAPSSSMVPSASPSGTSKSSSGSSKSSNGRSKSGSSKSSSKSSLAPSISPAPTATPAPTSTSKSKKGGSKSKRQTPPPVTLVPIDFTLCYEIPDLLTTPTEEQVDALEDGTSEFYMQFFRDLYDDEDIDFESLELMITAIELLPDGGVGFCAVFEGFLTFEGNEVPSSEEVFQDIQDNADADQYLEEVVQMIDGFESAADVFFTNGPTFEPTASPGITPSPTPGLPTNVPGGTAFPTPIPSSFPTTNPTSTPGNTDTPTEAPAITSLPTDSPGTATPTSLPTDSPGTSAPTFSPTSTPTSAPAVTAAPTVGPSPSPSETPTSAPTPGQGFTTDLDLTNVAAQFQDAFTMAATRWDMVIVGDLEDVPVSQEDKDMSECNNLPDVIDDVHICAEIAPGDGVGGVLGSASPEMVRLSGDNRLLTTVGTMTFDTADIEELVNQGTFEAVILHEMGHVYGIGTLWQIFNLIDDFNVPCPYELDSRASAEYQTLSGCTTAVPTEEDGGGGTACGHWDEVCFGSELMTGFSTGGLELSRVTAAGLEDMGYTVDYGQTDTYTADQMDPSCRCNNIKEEPKEEAPKMMMLSDLMSNHQLGPKLVTPRTRNGSRNLLNKHSRRQLSDEGRQKAVSYGKGLLKAKHVKQTSVDTSSSKMKYIGDMFVSVIYAEHGEIFAVEVWGDDFD